MDEHNIEDFLRTYYFDLYLEHDINGIFATKSYEKPADFNFPIVNYPFLDSNVCILMNVSE